MTSSLRESTRRCGHHLPRSSCCARHANSLSLDVRGVFGQYFSVAIVLMFPTTVFHPSLRFLKAVSFLGRTNPE
jgi:hypothetical protein